jgi:hypothetical protein
MYLRCINGREDFALLNEVNAFHTTETIYLFRAREACNPLIHIYYTRIFDGKFIVKFLVVQVQMYTFDLYRTMFLNLEIVFMPYGVCVYVAVVQRTSLFDTPEA